MRENRSHGIDEGELETGLCLGTVAPAEARPDNAGLPVTAPVPYSTADYVKNYYFNTPTPDYIVFWGRYFLFGTSDTFNASTEPAALKNAGIGYVLPICDPKQTRLSTGGTTGYNDGYSDGQTVCTNIANAVGNNSLSPGVHWPSNYALYVWLDVETSTLLHYKYWAGWHDGVRASYAYVPSLHEDIHLFYPCAYCNPVNGQGDIDGTIVNVCKVLTYDSSYKANGIWSSEPEPGTCDPYCYSPGPSSFETSAVCPDLATFLWQYSEEDQCTSCPNDCCGGDCPFPHVDLDMSNPAYTVVSNMLTVS